VRRPDIRRAQTLLGWQPRVSLADGLRHTIEDFRRRLDRDADAIPGEPKEVRA
jgi:nucleoside-diphosphate-sugar epimerase